MDEKTFKKLFGARIKYLRTIAGLSQEKLAERTNLSTQTISYIENGKNTISFNKLPLLAEAFDVPVYKLFVFAENLSGAEKFNYLLESVTEKELNIVTEVLQTILTKK